MAMIKCSKCKKTISDSDKICPYCGEEPRLDFKCPKCGSKNISFDETVDQKKAAALNGARVAGGLVGMAVAYAAMGGSDKSLYYICKDCNHKFSGKAKKK